MNGGGPWDVSSRILAGKWLGPTYAPGWSVGQERWARSGSVVQIPSISPPLAHGGRNPLTALRDSGRIAAGCGRPVLSRVRPVDIDRDGEGQNGSRSFAARICPSDHTMRHRCTLRRVPAAWVRTHDQAAH